MVGPKERCRLWLAVIFVLAAVRLGSATHFRYGTISWCSRGVKNYPNEVDFDFQMVFRRNYDWGRWYGEQWAPPVGKGAGAVKVAQKYTGAPGFFGTPGDSANPAIVNTWQRFPKNTNYFGYRLKFPAGQGVNLLRPNDGRVPCSDPLKYPGQGNVTDNECIPWSETVGWFYGDGTYGDLELTIRDMDFDEGGKITGNWLRGYGSLSHKYPAPTSGFGVPWTAFFAGGNRVSSLRNNHDGRWRLFTTISLIEDNCSPKAVCMPIVPMPYVARNRKSEYGWMSTFQIPAFDPDYGETITFRIGSAYEHGYLLQHKPFNAAGEANNAWTKAQWDALIENTIKALPAGTPTPTTFGPDQYANPNSHGREWVDKLDYAHPPDDMVIDARSGVVTWETGISAWEDDPNPYGDGRPKPATFIRKLPGLYNLVVMISSSSHDTTAPKYDVTVPLDFLIYLYHPLYYCKQGCKRSATSPFGIGTFYNTDGLYGDWGYDATVGDRPTLWQLKGTVSNTASPGTGKCVICGGGDNAIGAIYDDGFCKPTTGGAELTAASGTECDGSVCQGLRLNAGKANINFHTNCTALAAGDKPGDKVAKSVVPATGACKKNKAPFFIFKKGNAVDPDPLRQYPPTPDGTPDPEESDDYPIKRAMIRYKLGEVPTFNLVAHDTDDCVQLEILDIGLYYTANTTMSISTATRDGMDGKQIRRVFSWDIDWDVSVNRPMYDDRAMVPDVTVCFFAFDQYLFSKFFCARLQLWSPPVYWMDHRPWPESLNDFTGPTPCNNTLFVVTPGNEVTFPLQAKQGGGKGPLKITLTQGALPPRAWIETIIDATFGNGDPVKQIFHWVPKPGEECEYRLCFMVHNTQRESAETLLRQSFKDERGVEDERCFTIRVTDMGLKFEDGAAIVANSVAPGLLSQCGISLGAWFLASPNDTNPVMPLVTSGFGPKGEKEDSVFTLVHQLAWQAANVTTYNDSVNTQLEGPYYQVAYNWGFGNITTEPLFVDGAWHYAFVSIDVNGSAALYVDGIERVSFFRGSYEALVWDMVNGTMPYQMFLDEINAAYDKTNGYFVIGSTPERVTPWGTALPGQNTTAILNEIRVYNRSLSAEEVAASIFTPLDPLSEFNLIAYYNFNEGSLLSGPTFGQYPPAASTCQELLTHLPTSLYWAWEDGFLMVDATVPLNDSSGHENYPLWNDVGALSYVWVPSPLGAACPTTVEPQIVHMDGGECVRVNGSNFAPSQWLRCRLGEEIVPATWISPFEVECCLPCRKAFGAVAIEVANDAVMFSEKEIPVYYLELAMEFDGKTEFVSANGTCDDLESFTEGWSVGGWVYPYTMDHDAIIWIWASYTPHLVVVPPRPRHRRPRRPCQTPQTLPPPLNLHPPLPPRPP